MSYNNREYIPTHIGTGTTTSLVFSGKGILHSIVVNSSTAVIVGAFDALTNASGTVALLKASVAEGPYEYDAVCANGLFITTGVGGDYTVLWTR